MTIARSPFYSITDNSKSSNVAMEESDMDAGRGVRGERPPPVTKYPEV